MDFWRRYRRNRLAVIGLFIVAFFVLLAIFPSQIASQDPYSIDMENAFAALSMDHIMGTDKYGRDIFSRVIYGSRVSLIVGISAALSATIIGILVGSISGYFGGRIDDLLMRITEIFQVIPRFFLALVMVAFLGPSVWNIIFALAILSWPKTARMIRAQYLTLKEREFVEAARAFGASDVSIIFGEIFPNALPPVIINSSLEIGAAILLEAALSFLGLGDPNNISWGYMLQDAQAFVFHGWWMPFFPGLMILLTVLGLNMVGDGLNETFNPKLREL